MRGKMFFFVRSMYDFITTMAVHVHTSIVIEEGLEIGAWASELIKTQQIAFQLVCFSELIACDAPLYS